MKVLGLSAFTQDGAAALVVDGRVAAAAAEESFSGKKSDKSFPVAAASYCLEQCGLAIKDLDLVVYFEDPYVEFDRKLGACVDSAPFSFPTFMREIPAILGSRLRIKDKINEYLQHKVEIITAPHPLSLAAAAFYPSPFSESCILVSDIVCGLSASFIAHGLDSRIIPLNELSFPDSLGLFLATFHSYVGLNPVGDEHKFEEIAGFGSPVYAEKIVENLVNPQEDGLFKLCRNYFCLHSPGQVNGAFEKLFARPARRKNEELTRHYFDVAASATEVSSYLLLKMVEYARKLTNSKNLCLGGSVVQNSTLARKVLFSKQFENVWITPVTNNCCAAMGASLLGYFQKNNRTSTQKNFASELPFLGSSYSQHDIELSLNLKKVDSVAIETEQQLLDLVCNFLESGKVVGWFQGRSVFGDHALGNRCVLADPRQSGILSHINQVLKQHENYRTYSVSILREELASFYYLPSGTSFYSMMNFSLVLKEQYRRRSDKQEESESETPDSSFSLFPSITRPDASSRVHVVDADTNPMFFRLLRNFRVRCGCPMLLNSSLNLYNKPVVRTPAEAIDCFIDSGMDVLVLGNRILRKA